MAIYGIDYINESVLNESILPSITLDEVKYARDVFKKYLSKNKGYEKFSKIFDDSIIDKKFKNNRNKSIIGIYSLSTSESMDISIHVKYAIDESNNELSDKKLKITQNYVNTVDVLTFIPAIVKLLKTDIDGGVAIYAKKIK